MPVEPSVIHRTQKSRVAPRSFLVHACLLKRCLIILKLAMHYRVPG